jgi:hypothetical protein
MSSLPTPYSVADLNINDEVSFGELPIAVREALHLLDIIAGELGREFSFNPLPPSLTSTP